MRSASVLVPRSASQESIGPGTAPAAFAMNWMRSARASSFSTQMPPIMSLWPFRYFVVEWNTMCAPYSSGRWKYGVANVLSTISSTPRRFAIAAGRREVGEAHERVRRRLEQQRDGLRRDRVLDALRIARVDEGERHAEVREDLVEQPIGAAVHVLAADDVVAGLEQLHQRVGAPHAARERESVPAAFERRDVPLERLARGIPAAGVLVPLVHPERVLHVGGGLHDRRHDGAGRGVGALTGVDRAGGEAIREVFVECARHTGRWMLEDGGLDRSPNTDTAD